ncbi:MAG: DNA-directed RNA polymerase subunit omega [Peptococcaceae bacterium]|jgi:DNA-directed RNA polymerase subunit omega|nr:DNA-directed RNA polymerase subunit omega [Peptococcaceae bacterium]
MKQPSLDELMENVDSKYSLVVAAAKRARKIMENPADDLVQGEKPVSTALNEIAEKKMHIECNPEGLK